MMNHRSDYILVTFDLDQLTFDLESYLRTFPVFQLWLRNDRARLWSLKTQCTRFDLVWFFSVLCSVLIKTVVVCSFSVDRNKANNRNCIAICRNVRLKYAINRLTPARHDHEHHHHYHYYYYYYYSDNDCYYY